MSLQGQWGDREHGHSEQCPCCATVCCAMPHGLGSAHLRNTEGSNGEHSRPSSCRRGTGRCWRVSAGGGVAAQGSAVFAARRGPATLGAAIRWPPATALPRSPASRERAGLQAAGLFQELGARGSRQLIPETQPYLELRVNRCLHRAERLEPRPSAPKPRGCAAPGPGIPRDSPLCSAFPAVHEQATSCWHCGGPLCHSLCRGLCPRVLCRWCCQAGWGLRCSAACANRTPAISPGMGTNESGTRTAGAARDGQLREVPVAGRLGVNAASFDFPGVYLPHRGGDFLPERKPCLAHALPDAIAPRYARSKVGHCSPAGYQVLSSPVKAPGGAESTAHADTPSTGWAGG